MKLYHLGLQCSSSKIHRQSNKNPNSRCERSYFELGNPRDSPNTEYCYCPSIPPRIWRQVTITEETALFGHRPQRIGVGSGLEASSLRTSFYSSRRCSASCQWRKAITSPSKVWNLWTPRWHSQNLFPGFWDRVSHTRGWLQIHHKVCVVSKS